MPTFFDFTYNLNTQESQNEVLNALGKARVKPFEPKSYFFTESSLPEQTLINGAYGPENGNSTTRFNITTQLNLTDKKAYAVTSGQVLIFPQNGSEDKVNVFIKPIKNIDIGVPIKYFVYRGLKKELFIDENNNILEYNEQTNTPFMVKVWTDLKNLNDLSDPLPDIPARLFGFSETDTPETRVDFKFFNVYDEETTDENKIYNLPIIEAGHYFGQFADNESGFEIVLNNDGFYYQERSDTGFIFDMSYARASRVVLDIADIASNPDISEKIYRENVQNFLDPAAFYGAHITEKNNGEVKITEPFQKFKTKADIFTNIISKFYNKHKFYLYIQGNRGRSFNFDGSLGTDPMKMEISGNVSPGAYQTYEWPIIISEIEQTHSNDESDDKKAINNFTFQLKFGTVGKKSILYNTYGNCANAEIEGNFLTSDALVDQENIATQEYTNSVDYNITNTYGIGGNTSLTTKSIASFVFLNYEEQKEIQYFNDFFGPIDIRPLIKPTITDASNIFQKTFRENSRIQYWGLDNYSRFQFGMFNSGLFAPPNSSDPPLDTLTRLYVLKKLNPTNSSDREFNSYIPQFPSHGIANNSDEYGAYIYGDKNYKVWKGKIKDGNEIIESLKLINFEAEGNVTSFINFGLTEVEFNKLIYDNEEVTSSNHIPSDATNLFFYLAPYSVVETTGTEFLRYNIGIKFDLPDGSSDIVFPSVENTVYVYTLDNHYFFTKNFSERFEFSEKFSEVEINFRPRHNFSGDPYNGEFGFDWMRLGDSLLDLDHPYKTAIVSGYEERFGTDTNTEFDTEKKAYRALKKEYINLPLFRPDNLILNPEPDDDLRDDDNLYYLPYLNLYPETAIGTPNPPCEAKLYANVHIRSVVKVLEYELVYNKNLFTVDMNIDEFPIQGKDKEHDVKVNIKCIREFDKDHYIKIFARTQVADQIPETKFAGIIKVCKNTWITDRRQFPTVLVKVRTNVLLQTDTDRIGIINDTTCPNETANLSKGLYQSLIYTNPVITEIDLSNNNKFHVGKPGSYINVNEEILPHANNNNLQSDLRKVLEIQKGKKYNNYFKIFVFDLLTPLIDGGRTIGNVDGIGVHSVNLYRERDNTTMVHEVLHGLGLLHTHKERIHNTNPSEFYPVTNPDVKYVFHHAQADGGAYSNLATDNIMSYNGAMRKTTWKWQWKKMKSNIEQNVYKSK